MNTAVPLWPEGKVPLATGSESEDVPTITVHPPTTVPNNGAAIVICPGGGYSHLAAHEADPIAEWANSLGATGVVLRYRLAPRYRHPAMLYDAARAMRTVRANAEAWQIDPNRIGVLGFSAGGHLASTISNHFDDGILDSPDVIERQSSRPDISILIYAVIALQGAAGHIGSRNNLLGEPVDLETAAHLSNDERVTEKTPPTFLVHSSDDKVVKIENSLRYALALEAAGVPFAFQGYENGGHGYGMGREGDPVTSSWPDQCARWMRFRGFLGGQG